MFERDKDGTVQQHKHAWYDADGIATVLDGQDILPGFELKLWQIDEALSHVSCHMIVNHTPDQPSFVTGFLKVGTFGQRRQCLLEMWPILQRHTPPY